MQEFFLVLMLAVFCNAAETESVYKASGASEGPDPYSVVGTCRQDIIDKRNKSFNIDEIANTGYYTYWMLTGYEEIVCAKAEIHGDKDNGYFGSVQRTTSDMKASSTIYSLKVLQPGVIEETFKGVDKNGKSVTNKYKLIVLFWDSTHGVFEYVRCSDLGTSTTDSRSIVIRECNVVSGNSAPRIADTLNAIDYLFNLNGQMRDIDIC